MRVTVFGGSTPRPGDRGYAEALRLGGLLAAAGHTVLTGGYIGSMEAVSRGAAEAGGHVIGVTCDEIETWRPVKPNAWVQEELRFATLRERLAALIDNCEAAIALAGGIGTLAEVAVMWSNLQTRVISTRPLILVGPGWDILFKHMYSAFDEYIPEPYRSFLDFARDVDEAVGFLG